MIVPCGEALVDFTPLRCGEAHGYRPRPGGSPANVAVALARLEAPAGFLGRLSRDAFGRLLRHYLADNRVDLRYVRDGPEPSTLAFIHVPEGGEPEFAFYGEGTADRHLLPRDLPDAFPPDVGAIHVGSIALVLEPIATTLEGLIRRERRARLISLDPNVRPSLIRDPAAYRGRLEGWLAAADIVKVSRADLAWLYPGAAPERSARRWRALGPAAVVVTLGPDGAEGFAPAGEARAGACGPRGRHGRCGRCVYGRPPRLAVPPRTAHPKCPRTPFGRGPRRRPRIRQSRGRADLYTSGRRPSVPRGGRSRGPVRPPGLPVLACGDRGGRRARQFSERMNPVSRTDVAATWAGCQ